jgi:hypothetical protein
MKTSTAGLGGHCIQSERKKGTRWTVDKVLGSAVNSVAVSVKATHPIQGHPPVDLIFLAEEPPAASDCLRFCAEPWLLSLWLCPLVLSTTA